MSEFSLNSKSVITYVHAGVIIWPSTWLTEAKKLPSLCRFLFQIYWAGFYEMCFWNTGAYFWVFLFCLRIYAHICVYIYIYIHIYTSFKIFLLHVSIRNPYYQALFDKILYISVKIFIWEIYLILKHVCCNNIVVYVVITES
jgi:hypothetical protein